VKRPIWQDVEKVLQLRSRFASEAQRTKEVRLASSFAAALLEGLFEHPVGYHRFKFKSY
jgi:hypothetical protein